MGKSITSEKMLGPQFTASKSCDEKEGEKKKSLFCASFFPLVVVHQMSVMLDVPLNAVKRKFILIKILRKNIISK